MMINFTLCKLFAHHPKKHLIPVYLIVFSILFLNSYVLISIGPELFLDSFQHPTYYISLCNQAENNDIFLMIQKPSHPKFFIKHDDIILSSNFELLDVNSIRSSEIYIQNDTLIGKIISCYGDNPIDFIAFSFWIFCKDNLNLYQILE
jgi:hypothetical protein